MIANKPQDSKVCTKIDSNFPHITRVEAEAFSMVYRNEQKQFFTIKTNELWFRLFHENEKIGKQLFMDPDWVKMWDVMGV